MTEIAQYIPVTRSTLQPSKIFEIVFFLPQILKAAVLKLIHSLVPLRGRYTNPSPRIVVVIASGIETPPVAY